MALGRRRESSASLLRSDDKQPANARQDPGGVWRGADPCSASRFFSGAVLERAGAPENPSLIGICGGRSAHRLNWPPHLSAFPTATRSRRAIVQVAVWMKAVSQAQPRPLYFLPFPLPPYVDVDAGWISFRIPPPLLKPSPHRLGFFLPGTPALTRLSAGSGVSPSRSWRIFRPIGAQNPLLSQFDLWLYKAIAYAVRKLVSNNTNSAMAVNGAVSLHLDAAAPECPRSAAAAIARSSAPTRWP